MLSFSYAPQEYVSIRWHADQPTLSALCKANLARSLPDATRNYLLSYPLHTCPYLFTYHVQVVKYLLTSTLVIARVYPNVLGSDFLRPPSLITYMQSTLHDYLWLPHC